QEKKLIVILALVNLIFFILSFFFPVLSMIFPFIAIICFCLIALSVSFRHFFLTPHVKEGETLPQSFVENYSLTPRETQIICAILGGKTNKELSDIFFVSLKTIETHLGNIYRKTGVKNRLELFSLLRQ
ncbi:MAG TPA: helix-turn-helix transcriptional regulator, partial [Treponemataceae bacterium]|nr:helix-turn-helix transcriptional regulator [Treponemataceae bacterium]